MKPWTIWERYNDDTERYYHNHTESGWVDGDKPAAKDPRFINQAKDWAKSDWRKIHCWKDGIKLVLDKPTLTHND